MSHDEPKDAQPNEESEAGHAPLNEDTMGENDSEERADESVRSLLRGTLGQQEPPEVDMLAGVQQRLRQRSQGRFYTNRWSTEEHPPVKTYLVTGALMLAVLLVILAVIYPLSGAASAITNEPAPVNVIPPKR